MKTIPVYAFSYRKSYYLTHPWKWFKELRTAAANLIHRMKYGFAWVDLWNTDSYLNTLIPSMLRELAQRCCGYPGNDKFPTMEVYREWLRALALIIELSNTESFEASEKYEDAMERIAAAFVSTEYPVIGELRRKVLETMEAGHDWNWPCELAVVGYAELGTYLYVLWD